MFAFPHASRYCRSMQFGGMARAEALSNCFHNRKAPADDLSQP